MIDFLYKISRKLLPSFLYRVFQRSALGRVKSWEKFSTYQNIFRFYESSIKESLTDKVIAETGCGNQIYTACLFLMNGARNVVLVEPKLDLINDNRAIKNAILIFRKHYPQFLLSETDVKSKISVFSGLEKVPEEMNGKIDMFFSHLVLEHIYPIEFFYSNVARLLSTDGFALNRVDLTDHTYHIFTKFKFAQKFCNSRALFHLRYSNRTFDFLNDPKCFMNRVSFPQHRELAAKYGFGEQIIEKNTCGPVRVHSDIRKAINGPCDDKDLFVTSFCSLLMKRRNER